MTRIAHLAAAALLCLGATAHADDAPPRCKYVQVGQLPIQWSGNSLKPTVDGSIDRTPAKMLLDTGSNRTYLTRTGTDKRNLPLRWSGGQSVAGVGGLSAVYLVQLQEFSVGPASRGKMNIGVIDSTGWTPAFDAIVGADFLMQSDLEIALADKRVTFYRPQDCKDSFLAYWDPKAMAVPILRSSDDKANPQVEVEVNGVKLVAIMDTGADYSTITVDAAKRAGVRTDSPGVTKLWGAVGVGSERAARWRARFDTFKIGDETVKNADIDIREVLTNLGGADILLGADFMRAHRVLFALSQRRVYLSYLGGTVFGAPEEGIEPWVLKEAEAGNPDAEFVLSMIYRSGKKVPRDATLADAWRDKAAAHNHTTALVQVSHKLRMSSQAPLAVERLRTAMAARPAEPKLAFELFLAQTQAGEREAAKRDLEPLAGKPWPAPIANYYLGRIDADALMRAARDDKSQAQARSCEAGGYIAELHRVMGDPARAKQVQENVMADCRRTPN